MVFFILNSLSWPISGWEIHLNLSTNSTNRVFICLAWFFMSRSTTFLVMLGWGFLAEPVLLKDKMQWSRWDSNPQPLEWVKLSTHSMNRVFVCLVLILYVPVNNFLVMLGWGFLADLSCSRTKCSAPCVAQTRNPSTESSTLPLSHCALLHEYTEIKQEGD